MISGKNTKPRRKNTWKRKDDGRVFPIQKRKPYGISRTLAYEDVQAMRNAGKRARLIETNTRLDLYAPYESVLPGSVNPNLVNTHNPITRTMTAAAASVIFPMIITPSWEPLPPGSQCALRLDRYALCLPPVDNLSSAAL